MERCYPCFFSLWATVSFSLFRCSGRIRSVTIETFAYDQFVRAFFWLLAVLFEQLGGGGQRVAGLGPLLQSHLSNGCSGL